MEEDNADELDIGEEFEPCNSPQGGPHAVTAPPKSIPVVNSSVLSKKQAEHNDLSHVINVTDMHTPMVKYIFLHS